MEIWLPNSKLVWTVFLVGIFALVGWIYHCNTLAQIAHEKALYGSPATDGHVIRSITY